MKYKILMLCLAFTMIFSVPVFAAPEDSEGAVEIPPNVTDAEAYLNLQDFKNLMNHKGPGGGHDNYISVVKGPKETDVPVEGEASNKEVEQTYYFGLYDGEVYFSVDDPEFSMWMSEIIESVGEDASEGLKALKDVTVTLDHIKLETWGAFLSKYNDKDIYSFPVGNVTMEYGDYSFIFASSNECKEFVIKYLVPPMVEKIVDLSMAYPAKRYALDIQTGSTLADYVCDLTAVRELETVYPFDGVENYIFSDTGSGYAVSLGREYVDILRGYIEGDKEGYEGYDRPVEGDVPGCVNVLAHITLLRNVSGGILSDKVLSDFTMYQNLAVCLDTKKLINVNDMSTAVKTLYYSDYKIYPEKLLLTPISDSVVIVQPTYLECFSYNTPGGLYERNFGRIMDATEFITTGDPNMTVEVVVETENGPQTTTQKIPLSYFTDNNGILDVRLGNSPFLMFYVSYTPYDLLVNWAYNQSSDYFTTTEARDLFIGYVKSDMAAQNRGEEFDTYVKAAGQMTDSSKTIIKVVIGIIVLAVVIVVVILVRKKLKADNNPLIDNRGPLFADNDFDYDDDDDDDYGSFELK